MASILHTIQIITALALIALVLLQRSSGDTSSTFGESSFFQTRRGFERFLFITTVVCAVLFIAASIAVLIVSR
jgi:protein translocase SecG subunit